MATLAVESCLFLARAGPASSAWMRAPRHCKWGFPSFAPQTSTGVRERALGGRAHIVAVPRTLGDRATSCTQSPGDGCCGSGSCWPFPTQDASWGSHTYNRIATCSVGALQISTHRWTADGTPEHGHRRRCPRACTRAVPVPARRSKRGPGTACWPLPVLHPHPEPYCRWLGMPC